MINNYSSRRVGQILFQGKEALGINDRFDLVWNWLDKVFQGFRANHFLTGFHCGLKLFKVLRVRFWHFHLGFENLTHIFYERQVRHVWGSLVFDLELRKIVSDPILSFCGLVSWCSVLQLCQIQHVFINLLSVTFPVSPVLFISSGRNKERMFSWIYFALTVCFGGNTCSLDTSEAVITPQTMIFGANLNFWKGSTFDLCLAQMPSFLRF